jgi:glycosyltransferase involved in cell wall biosynthesis
VSELNGSRNATRVLALVPYPTGRAPGQRYRIEQWAPLLRQYGVDVTFSSFLSPRGMDVLYERGHVAMKLREMIHGYMKRVREVLELVAADVVFVYREAALLGPAWIERLFSLRRPLVFDFDDAIYLRDTSRANSWAAALKPRTKVAAICRMATQVTVGNRVLARFAMRQGSDVTVIPSTIDTELYQVRPRRRNSVPVVGWTGSTTTIRYLDALAPVLRRLHEKREFEVHVIGGRVSIQGVSVRSMPWRAETEVEDVRGLDIGLMPLPDDEWSRGKCGLKALQYMALGIPPVVSPVGTNKEIVQDGVNGFHASTEEEWFDRVSLLLEDEGLRQRLGRAARRTVEEEYSARVHTPRLARLLASSTKR